VITCVARDHYSVSQSGLTNGMTELNKIGTLGGWIAKIETLGVELKIIANFGEGG
jgi:hypothetical protein